MTEAAPRIVGRVGDYAGKAPRTFPKGRVCAYLGCQTKLSTYNESRCCAVHQAWRKTAVRPAKQKEKPVQEEASVSKVSEERRAFIVQCKARVLALLQDAAKIENEDDHWVHKPGDMAPADWYYALDALRTQGGHNIVSRKVNGGGVRLCQTEVQQAPPQPPVIEQKPAESEITPGPGVAETLDLAAGYREYADIQPFAGILQTTEQDPEIAAMDALVRGLSPLDQAACRRVLEWAACRFVTATEERG